MTPKSIRRVNNPWGRGYYWEEYANSIDDAIAQIDESGTPCSAVRTHLEGTGYHDGYTRIRNSNCTRGWLTLATGVWINTNDPSGSTLCAKIDVAKGVIDDFLAEYPKCKGGSDDF